MAKTLYHDDLGAMVPVVDDKEWRSPRNNDSVASTSAKARGSPASYGDLCFPRVHGAGSAGSTGDGPGHANATANIYYKKLVGNDRPSDL